MKYLIFIMVLIASSAWGQNAHRWNTPFTVGSDTIAGVSTPDTVRWRISLDGALGPWNQITTYIDTTSKQNETTMVYILSNEPNWTWGQELQVGILSGATSISGKSFKTGGLNGAITLWIVPDTTGTSTLYNGSKLGGM